MSGSPSGVPSGESRPYRAATGPPGGRGGGRLGGGGATAAVGGGRVIRDARRAGCAVEVDIVRRAAGSDDRQRALLLGRDREAQLADERVRRGLRLDVLAIELLEAEEAGVGIDVGDAVAV